MFMFKPLQLTAKLNLICCIVQYYSVTVPISNPIYIKLTIAMQFILPDAIKYVFIIWKSRKVLNLYSHDVTFSTESQ